MPATQLPQFVRQGDQKIVSQGKLPICCERNWRNKFDLRFRQFEGQVKSLRLLQYLDLSGAMPLVIDLPQKAR